MESATKTQSPVACKLSAEDLRRRRGELQRKLWGQSQEIVEIDDGFALRFAPGDGLIQELAELIAFESQCCPFMTYSLVVPAEGAPISLRLTGPEGTKQFLREMLP